MQPLPTFSYTNALFYDPNPQSTLDTAGGTLRGKGTEVAAQLGPRRLTEFIDVLAEATGLWLSGNVTHADVAALARLPKLRHVDLRPSALPIPEDVLRGFSGLSLASLRLRTVAPSAFAALAGLKVRALSLNTPNEDSGDVAAWSALASLGVEELTLKGAIALPVEGAVALAKSGLRRFTGQLPVGAEARSALLSGPLEVLSLQHFSGEPARVTVEGNPHLRLLELLGTYLSCVRLVNCGALAVLTVQLAERTELVALPSLRVVPAQGDVVLEDLAAVENIVAVGPVASLSIEGLPALRRVELMAGYGNASVEAAARAASAAVLTGPGAIAKASTDAPKRTVSPKERKHPRLGWDGAPYAVLMVGKAASFPLLHKAAESARTVAAWWSNDRGLHIAAAAALDATTTDLEGGVPDLVLGRVIGCVGAGQDPLAIDRAAIEAALAAASELEALWGEASGVVKKDAFNTAELGVYLLACGPNAQAVLSAGSTRLAWCDEAVVPCARLDVSTLADGMHLSLAPSGPRFVHPPR